MQFLSFVLFQLDEARRYLEDGRLQHLRLAILLLDNAAEIQMDRCIKGELVHDEFKEILKRNIVDTTSQRPHMNLTEDLKELAAWVPLTEKKKYDLDRHFDEKVSYLVGRGGHLPPSMAKPLRHLHQYRNEAYHRATVRPDTIRAAALILLEINCQMLLTMTSGWSSFSSGEDYSWLEVRFGYKPFLDESKLPAIIDEIRGGLLPSVEIVADTLAKHLEDRFSAFNESLDFIVQNGGIVVDRQAALHRSQVNSKHPRQSIEWIQKRAASIPKVRAASSRLESFERFASIEELFEPLEECVNNLAREIDQGIQIAIDLARGK
jgi:hypothetical protein